MTENELSLVVGITGKCCSGKDEAAAVFSDKGWQVIDVDSYGHRALETKQAEVLSEFGSVILGGDGRIDRKKLGKIVFADRKSLRRLEAIVHPEMRSEVAETVGAMQRQGESVCINAALLFPMGLDTLCNAVVIVKAPLLARYRRARRRDGLSPLRIVQRFLAQRLIFAKKNAQNVDMYTVRNSSDKKALQRQVEECIKLIKRQG